MQIDDNLRRCSASMSTVKDTRNVIFYYEYRPSGLTFSAAQPHLPRRHDLLSHHAECGAVCEIYPSFRHLRINNLQQSFLVSLFSISLSTLQRNLRPGIVNRLEASLSQSTVPEIHIRLLFSVKENAISVNCCDMRIAARSFVV